MHTDVATPANTNSRRSWVFICIFVILTGVVNIAIIPAIDWFDVSIRQRNLLFGFFGFVCGEACIAAVLSGLTGRTWLTGFFLGVVIATHWFLGFVVGAWFVDGFEILALVGISVLPWTILIISGPLIALRLFGWRLVHHAVSHPNSRPGRIADLFHSTAIVAATLTLLRVPEIVLELDAADYWIPVVIASAAAFATSVVVLPIATRLAFSDWRLWKSAVGFALLAASVMLITFLIAQCFYDWDADWESRNESLQPISIVVGIATTFLYLFTAIYSRFGMILVRRRHRAQPDVREEIQPQPAFSRGRWQTAAVIVLAVLANVALARLQSWRAVQDREIERLKQIAVRRMGRIDSSNRVVTWINLGEGTTDADLEQFAECSGLLYLHISSKDITDRSLAQIGKYENLTSLSLNYTSITDDGLAQLSNLKQLWSLSLVKTQITGSGLKHLAGKLPIDTLNLDGTQLTDANCQLFTQMTGLQSLSLKATPISEIGLDPIRNLPQLLTLDLSRTAVEGTGLRGCQSIQALYLSGCQTTDESLRSLAELENLHVVALPDTKTTDRAIDHLLQHQDLSVLDLNRTQISDEGVARLSALTSLERLSLSGTSITAKGFRNWPPSPNLTLDLADTGLDDSTLPFLASMGVTEIAIANTKVTLQGILAAKFVSLELLIVGPHQFSEAEIQRLKPLVSAEVIVMDEDEKPPQDEQ